MTTDWLRAPSSSHKTSSLAVALVRLAQSVTTQLVMKQWQ